MAEPRARRKIASAVERLTCTRVDSYGTGRFFLRREGMTREGLQNIIGGKSQGGT